MSGQRYTPEFKDEAVKLVTERRYSVADIADRLGVSQHSVYKWVKAADPRPNRQEELELIEAKKEILRLKGKLKQAEEERDILKNVWSAPFLQVKARCQNTFASMYPACL